MLSKKFYLAILCFVAVSSIFVFLESWNGSADYGRFRLEQNLDLFRDTSERYQADYSSLNRRTLDNLPEIYYDEKPKAAKSYNKSCGRFPDLFDLQFHNTYWQVQETTNGTLHLFSAHFDERKSNLVRIIATYDVYRPQDHFWCQFWYDGPQSKIVESETPYWMFRQKWGADKGYFHHPYLITCPLVKSNNQDPIAVSLVENPCDEATNNLKLTHRKETHKKNFVVCVKGLSFPFDDNSVRLAEWIELVNLLGAQKLHLYKFSVHPQVEKVLDYYSGKGLVEVTPLSVVGQYSNHPALQNRFLRKKMIARRLQEVIPYNDCLYKHLEEFRYVVLLDTDEVIVPREETWLELLERMERKFPNASSYVARNVYFLDSHQHNHEWFKDIPKYMHILQHVERAQNYTKPGHFVKGFHDTRRVTSLHNHFPFSCLGNCINKEIDLDLAHLQHYRADCVSGVKNCEDMKENSVVDSRVWNFKDELIRRVQKTIQDLDLVVS